MKKIIIFVFILVFLNFTVFTNIKTVKADEINENVQTQLDELDFTQLEEFLDQIKNRPESFAFKSIVNKLLNGEYKVNYNTIFQYLLSIIFVNLKSMLPSILSIIAIALFCTIFKNLRSSFTGNGVTDVINFICYLSIILIVSTEFFNIYENSKIIIKNIAKFNEIMSPIIISLMVVAGGKVSATVFNPIVTIFSFLTNNIFYSFVLPIVSLIMVINVINCFSTSIKFNRYAEFFNSIIKWTLGIITTIFSMFFIVQGISSASFDGIKYKATKFAVSNSIPVVGGFLKDSVDLVVAGSILIKNSIGVAGIFVIFYIIFSPLINMAIFSLLLKWCGAVLQTVSDKNISDLCFNVSKCVSNIIAIILVSGLILFVTVVLMIICTNSFI